MGEILIPRRTKVEKGYELLADITVELAPVTNVDISGLNIGKGDEIVLVGDIYNASASFAVMFSIFVNSNTSNYYTQQLSANGTSISGARTAFNDMVAVQPTRRGQCFCKLKLTNSGYFVCQSASMRNYDGGSGIVLEDKYISSTFTISSITQLTLSSSTSTTNAIGIGSRFQLYKIGGA